MHGRCMRRVTLPWLPHAVSLNVYHTSTLPTTWWPVFLNFRTKKGNVFAKLRSSLCIASDERGSSLGDGAFESAYA